jgi:hypothetical protein
VSLRLIVTWMVRRGTSANFLCALGPCIQGFQEGCRPYLSVNSTRLNGRWCGQLAAACGVDDQNWMYPVTFEVFGTEIQNN